MILKGYIQFDPLNFTSKHFRQSKWKKTAQVIFKGDETDAMWRWWLKKRYNLELLRNVRGSHLTFINDRLDSWHGIDKKYSQIAVNVELGHNLRSNGEHWWLKPEYVPEILTKIRVEAGLSSDPHFPYHYTIGMVNPKKRQHSEYIRKIRQGWL